MAKCWEKLHFDDKLNALSPITTSVQRLCGGESGGQSKARFPAHRGT
jgi:hypothetical protein